MGANRAKLEWPGTDLPDRALRWRPRSGVNDVSPAPSMEMLGDCCDGFFGLCIRVAGSVDWGWRVEELAA